EKRTPVVELPVQLHDRDPVADAIGGLEQESSGQVGVLPGTGNGGWRSGDGSGTLLGTRPRPGLRGLPITIASVAYGSAHPRRRRRAGSPRTRARQSVPGRLRGGDGRDGPPG